MRCSQYFMPHRHKRDHLGNLANMYTLHLFTVTDRLTGHTEFQRSKIPYQRTYKMNMTTRKKLGQNNFIFYHRKTNIIIQQWNEIFDWTYKVKYKSCHTMFIINTMHSVLCSKRGKEVNIKIHWILKKINSAESSSFREKKKIKYILFYTVLQFIIQGVLCNWRFYSFCGKKWGASWHYKVRFQNDSSYN